MIKRTLLTATMAAVFSTGGWAAQPALSFSKLWTHVHNTAGQTSEIPAFDRKTDTLWVAGVVGVDVLDVESGALLEHIDVTPYGYVNSVAIHNGLAAFAVESAGDRRDPGVVIFYDTKTRLPSSGVSSVAVGSLPDMLTFSHDGSRLLVANEATPNVIADAPYILPDPAGTVSIIDMETRSVMATPGFNAVAQSGSYLRTNTGMDFEPEYIAITKDGSKAFVTLQEGNGMAVLDLASNSFTKVIGLGVKDFSLADNGFGGNNFIDPNDRDYLSGSSGPTKAELRPVPVKGLYQPDAIATYTYRGKTYVVMANEGDTREDEGDKARASTLPGTPNDLKRLNISTTDPMPGDLVTFGGRSVSIRDEVGTLVYDSGSLLDAEAIARGIYDDGRSDDKGVEPEGVALLEIAGRTYAFVGLERTKKSAVAVFDITEPANTRLLDMIVTEGDVSPEGITAFHHRGRFYLAIAHEVSNTTTLYRIDTK
jgi:DNA-binding beta-propeller fold protein YncE